MERQKSVSWALALGLVGWVLIWSACARDMDSGRHVQPVPKTQAAAVQGKQWSATEYATMAERGKKVFVAQCAECHTVDGLANLDAPDLSDYGSEGWSHLRTADYVHDAQRYYPGTEMPSFDEKVAKKKKEMLTDAQIDDATAYVRSLKDRAIYPTKIQIPEHDMEHGMEPMEPTTEPAAKPAMEPAAMPAMEHGM